MPTPEPSPRLNPVFDNTSRAAALAVIGLALLALAGWTFDAPLLARAHPTWTPMNPMTAVCFVFCGAALLLLRKEPQQRRTRWAGGAAAMCAGFVAGVALVKLSDFLPGGAVHIDQILFRRRLDGNVIAPNTVVAFGFLAVAMLLLDARNTQVRWAATALTLATAGVALLALTGYLYSVLALYQVGRHLPMAVHTAACFLLLCVGVLPPRPDREPLATLLSATAGG